MNDKKKLILVIALAVVVLGVGAFQFVNSGAEKPKPKEAPKAEQPVEPEESVVQVDPALDYIVKNTTPRDPFQEGQLPLAEGQTPPPSNPPPPRTIKTGGNSQFKLPPSLGGFNPLLPNVSNGGAPTGVGVRPGPVLRLPGDFSFQLRGVITGHRPAAVFSDDNGNQRLVTVGSSLGGDSQLVGVEGDHVTVRHKGKYQTYTVGGTPNAK